MKKLFCLMLILSMTLIPLLTFTSCDEKTVDVASADELHKATKDGSVKVTQHAGGTSYDYNGDKTSINITADFTIDASHDFFTAILKDNVPGRMMKEAVIEGNGHTITVTGNIDGKLGRYNTGLFARLDNCEVRNLNIIYDTDVKIDGTHGAKFGGLTADACATKITNCTVTYAGKLSVGFMTNKNGYHDSAFGGLVGVLANITRLHAEGITGEDLIRFNLIQVAAHVVCWAGVAPVLEILLYNESMDRIFEQGLTAALSNAVTTAVVGSLLLLAWSALRSKRK